MVDGLSMVDRQSFPPYYVEPEVTNMAGKDMEIWMFGSRYFELQQPKWRETVFLDLFDLCSRHLSAPLLLHACLPCRRDGRRPPPAATNAANAYPLLVIRRWQGYSSDVLSLSQLSPSLTVQYHQSL
jgi:hypothetical protein